MRVSKEQDQDYNAGDQEEQPEGKVNEEKYEREKFNKLL